MCDGVMLGAALMLLLLGHGTEAVAYASMAIIHQVLVGFAIDVISHCWCGRREHDESEGLIFSIGQVLPMPLYTVAAVLFDQRAAMNTVAYFVTQLAVVAIYFIEVGIGGRGRRNTVSV